MFSSFSSFPFLAEDGSALHDFHIGSGHHLPDDALGCLVQSKTILYQDGMVILFQEPAARALKVFSINGCQIKGRFRECCLP